MGHFDSVPLREKAVFRRLGPDGRGGLPFSAYTRTSTRLMLGAHAWMQRWSPEEKVVGIAEALFPVNGRDFYFRLFGRKGFREYQLLVPRPRRGEVSEAVPWLMRRRKVPEGEEARRLFDDLDALVFATGSLVNLSKDSRIDGAFASALFPRYHRFKRELAAFDPRRRVGI